METPLVGPLHLGFLVVSLGSWTDERQVHDDPVQGIPPARRPLGWNANSVGVLAPAPTCPPGVGNAEVGGPAGVDADW